MKKKIISVTLGMVLTISALCAGQSIYATEYATEEQENTGTEVMEQPEIKEDEELQQVQSGFVYDESGAELYDEIEFPELVSGSYVAGNRVEFYMEIKNIYTSDIAIDGSFDSTYLYYGAPFEEVVIGGDNYIGSVSYKDRNGNVCDFMEWDDETGNLAGGMRIHPGETYGFYFSFIVPEMEDGDDIKFTLVTVDPSSITESGVIAKSVTYALSNHTAGFGLTAEPLSSIVAGEELVTELQVTNRMKDRTLSVETIACWYGYGDIDGNGSPYGMDLEYVIKDDKGNVVQKDDKFSVVQNNISFAPGETKKYYISIVVPENADASSKLNFYIVGGEDGLCTGECVISIKPDYSFLVYDIGEGLPGIHLVLDEWKELKNSIFTSEELASGTDLQVQLIANQMDVSAVAQKDMQTIQSVAGKKKLGSVIDLSIAKVVNGQSTLISELSAPIRVTINIPEELRADNHKFSVIRLHEGVATELSDLDNDPNTVTISTDKFSTYTLVYEEIETTSSVGSPKTGDNASLMAVMTLLVLSLGAFAIVRKKNV